MGKFGVKPVLVALLFAAAGLWIWLYSVAEQKSTLKIVSLPIRYVRTEGVFQYLDKEDIKAAIEPLANTGFLEANMQAIHLAVSALPWVDSVSVRRLWPDTIDIKVTEKKPFVRWGKDSLMTEQGIIFTPKSVAQHQNLILVTASEPHRLRVLEIMKGIKTALADDSLELAEFSINNRWSWRIRLTTGLEILLGRDGQLKKLQRFLRTLPLLGQQQVDVGTMAVVDLRYPNGYAVSWKPEPETVGLETPVPDRTENVASQKIQINAHIKKR